MDGSAPFGADIARAILITAGACVGIGVFIGWMVFG